MQYNLRPLYLLRRNTGKKCRMVCVKEVRKKRPLNWRNGGQSIYTQELQNTYYLLLNLLSLNVNFRLCRFEHVTYSKTQKFV